MSNADGRHGMSGSYAVGEETWIATKKLVVVLLPASASNVVCGESCLAALPESSLYTSGKRRSWRFALHFAE